jgi:hypothetical protein
MTAYCATFTASKKTRRSLTWKLCAAELFPMVLLRMRVLMSRTPSWAWLGAGILATPDRSPLAAFCRRLGHYVGCGKRWGEMSKIWKNGAKNLEQVWKQLDRIRGYASVAGKQVKTQVQLESKWARKPGCLRSARIIPWFWGQCYGNLLLHKCLYFEFTSPYFSQFS